MKLKRFGKAVKTGAKRVGSEFRATWIKTHEAIPGLLGSNVIIVGTLLSVLAFKKNNGPSLLLAVVVVWTGIFLVVKNLAWRKAASPTPIPSRRIQKVLTSKDIVQWEGSLHPLHLWVWWLAAIFVHIAVIKLCASGLAIGAAVFWWTFMISLGIRVMIWRHDRFFVTNTHLQRLDSLFSRKTRKMSLSAMTDATLDEPFWSLTLKRLGLLRVGYIHIDVESAGQDQALKVIRFLNDPKGVREALQ